MQNMSCKYSPCKMHIQHLGVPSYSPDIRQQIASDPRVQAYIMGWKTMFPGAIEIDVYQVL